MVFPSADGFFSGVGSMVVRGDKLVSYFLLCHEFFEAWRAFVVQELELGGEATRN